VYGVHIVEQRRTEDAGEVNESPEQDNERNRAVANSRRDIRLRFCNIAARARVGAHLWQSHSGESLYESQQLSPCPLGRRRPCLVALVLYTLLVGWAWVTLFP